MEQINDDLEEMLKSLVEEGNQDVPMFGYLYFT